MPSLAIQSDRIARQRSAKELRARGLSLPEIGRKLGVHHSTILADLGGRAPRKSRRHEAMERLEAGPLSTQWVHLRGRPVLFNVLTRALRVGEYNAINRVTQHGIQPQLRRAGLVPMRPIEHVTIAVGHPLKSRCDKDAIWWWGKSIIDGLKAVGLLAGDDSETCFPLAQPFFTLVYPSTYWETKVVIVGVEA